MGAKGQTQQLPKPTGLDDLDVPTNETDQPVTYFAGIAKLNVSWLMVPLITKIVAIDPTGK